MNLRDAIQIVDRKLVPINSMVMVHDNRIPDTGAFANTDMEYTLELRAWRKVRVSRHAYEMARDPDVFDAEIKKTLEKDMHRALTYELRDELNQLEYAIRHEGYEEQVRTFSKVMKQLNGY